MNIEDFYREETIDLLERNPNVIINRFVEARLDWDKLHRFCVEYQVFGHELQQKGLLPSLKEGERAHRLVDIIIAYAKYLERQHKLDQDELRRYRGTK